MRLLLLALVLLWLQLYWTLVATWRFGEYYSYGWFVPVLAAGLAWRRWQMLIAASGSVPPASAIGRPDSIGLPQTSIEGLGQDARATGGPGILPEPNSLQVLPTAGEISVTTGRPAPTISPPLRVARWVVAVALLAVLSIAPLRLITLADPAWRPPVLLQALVTFGLTHFMIWQVFGRRISLGLLPVTVFALSAVPYPWQFERELIRSLTGTVVGLTREVFLLTGQPVELLGERLSIGREGVDVTDGCSGIRSFQSLVMVALFFGELLLLALSKRLMLVVVAGACAIVVNTARAYWLATIHFGHGKAAAAEAHDRLGHTAYGVSAAILFVAALWLLRTKSPGQRIVRRTQVVQRVPEKLKAEG